MSSILKTDQLIKTIRRRAFIPRSQETFTDADFLEMATEEVNLGLVPLIQRLHEEHLVYFIDVPLVRGKTNYEIPSRAHGDKVRDVSFVDENGNFYEMFRYSLDEISDFSSSTIRSLNRGFYLQNNDIILTGSEFGSNSKLRIFFFMRPNVLVLPERVGQAGTITTQYETDNISPVSGTIVNITAGTSTIITTSSAHNLLSGQTVQISGTDSTPSISGNYEVSVLSGNSFSISFATTIDGTSGSFVKQIQVKQISFTKIPKNFSQQLKYDIVQNYSPNKIVHYDVSCNSLNNATNTISLIASEVPNLRVGFYISQAEESCVPNIPTELHPLLAQRVAVACLESLGDEQNKQSAERKLKEMEMNANTFLDNRVVGANQKIKSRHSPLAQTLNGLGRKNRRW